MQSRTLKTVSFPVAIIAAFAGYALVVGPPAFTTPAMAHPNVMPVNPHILYLAPEGAQRGMVSADIMRQRGASLVQNWQSARAAGQSRALDAVLVDAELLETARVTDREWLRLLFQDGVVLVGLGVDDDQFAQMLGLQTFRVPGEANVPLGETGYRLTHSLILGTPEDIANSGDWISRAMRGDDSQPAIIQSPMIRSYGSARGELNSDADLDLLFRNLWSAIEGTCRTRASIRK